jgi:hypothetical protein
MSHCAVIFAIGFTLLFAPTVHSQALDATPSIEPRLFPQYPNARDKRYLGFYDTCGDEAIEEPVRLVRTPLDTQAFELDLKLRDEAFFCFFPAPPFAKTLHLVELPLDVPMQSVRVRVRKFGVVQSDRVIFIPYSSPLPPSVAGAWNNPTYAAQGVYLSFTTLPGASGIRRDAITMTWTTYDSAGKPMWLAGAATIPMQSSSAPTYTVEVPLYALTGGAFPSATQVPPTQSSWGTARLEYLACDRLGLRWFPVDGSNFPPGAIELQQLVYSSTQPCDIERYETDNYRRVKIITPVVE